MAKAQSPVSEIAAMVRKPGRSLPWWERVPPDVAAMLPAILDGWCSGDFGTCRRPAARAITAWLQQRGVEIGEQGVDQWLRRNPR